MAQATILPDPRQVELVTFVGTATGITAVVRARAASSPCPVCGLESERVHPRYTHRVADLPWCGVAARLQLQVRRFFCDWPTCPRAIFTERLPGMVAPFARRTVRLTQFVELVGFLLGGSAGTRLLRGAEPGMVLAIHIEAIRPGAWDWNSAGGWPSAVNTRIGVAHLPERMHLWSLDADAGTGRNLYGHIVRLRPFMGVLAMPPNEPGRHPTAPPRRWGGNLDFKELVAGSTLYLPIPVPGALFSVGDGHAAQGDGEVSSTAIECPMELVELRFEILQDVPFSTPRAETPAGWLTLGFAEDLQEASMCALEAMLDLMGERVGLERQDALTLASVAVDLRVTQLVNGGMLGVHALVPHGAIG